MLTIMPYLKLMRFDRPIGFLLLLWPTYWALWVAASGMPTLSIWLIFSCGVVVMRAAGCVINDILDRNIDPHVARTKQRPLAAGQISLSSALVLLLILSALALTLVLLLNRLSLMLAILAMVLTLLYPLMKRYTHWPQLILGLVFSMGIPMAFAAQNGQLPLAAWLLYITNVLWTIAYDTEYAMVDRADDIVIGVKSTAVLFGQYDRLCIGILQCLVLMLLLVIAHMLELHAYFYVAWTAGLLLFIYQQRLIYSTEPDACFRAFIHNHWFGLVIFIGFMLG